MNPADAEYRSALRRSDPARQPRRSSRPEVPSSAAVLAGCEWRDQAFTVGQARWSSASGRANDALRNAFNERRRSTTSPVATIGVDWATHCMHIGSGYPCPWSSGIGRYALPWIR